MSNAAHCLVDSVCMLVLPLYSSKIKKRVIETLPAALLVWISFYSPKLCIKSISGNAVASSVIPPPRSNVQVLLLTIFRFEGQCFKEIRRIIGYNNVGEGYTKH